LSASPEPTAREQLILQIIETARAKPPRFKDEQVTMAHGAGGRASQSLIEGLLVPELGSPSSGTPGSSASKGWP
jgi:hydrogenase expression/formation protein HypE